MFLLLAITSAKLRLLKEMNGNVTSSIQYNGGSFCHCVFRKENRTDKRKIGLQYFTPSIMYNMSL